MPSGGTAEPSPAASTDSSLIMSRGRDGDSEEGRSLMGDDPDRTIDHLLSNNPPNVDDVL